QAAREPQPPRRGDGVEPKPSVLARDRTLPVGEAIVSLVLLPPRLQNLSGVFDDSVSAQGNVQKHAILPPVLSVISLVGVSMVRLRLVSSAEVRHPIQCNLRIIPRRPA